MAVAAFGRVTKTRAVSMAHMAQQVGVVCQDPGAQFC